MNKKPVIVTGLSGAGITSVLKTLEDFDYEVFDNFPVSLVQPLVEDIHADDDSSGNIAIGIDTRTRGFSVQAVLDLVRAIHAKLLFVTCDDSVLQKRFTETRRRHPMAQGRSVRNGIEQERKMLGDIQSEADILLDTSEYSIHDMRHVLEGHFQIKPQEQLSVTLMSFGFRHGVPREADIVMDVRFLRNPHWDTELKPKTGLDDEVGAYILKDGDFEMFVKNFKALIEPLLPRYAFEGKRYLTIAIGCTGGRHRSVFTVRHLSDWFKEKGLSVYIENRDLKGV